MLYSSKNIKNSYILYTHVLYLLDKLKTRN